MDGGRVTSVTFAGNDPIIAMLFAMYDAPQSHKPATVQQARDIVPFMTGIEAARLPEILGLQVAQVGTATSETDLIQQLNISHPGSYSLPSSQPFPASLDSPVQPQQPAGQQQEPSQQTQPSEQPQQEPSEGQPGEPGSSVPATPEDAVSGDLPRTGVRDMAASETAPALIDMARSRTSAPSSYENEPDADGTDVSAVLAGFTGWSAAVNGGSLPEAARRLLNRDGFKRLKDTEDNRRFRWFGGR
jgi:hypothetical protein